MWSTVSCSFLPTSRPFEITTCFIHFGKIRTFLPYGFDEPDAALLLDKKAAPGQRTTLFLRPRNPEREMGWRRRLGVERAVEALGIDAAQPIEALSEVLKSLLPERSCLNYQMGQPFRVEQDKIVLDALSVANRRRKNF